MSALALILVVFSFSSLSFAMKLGARRGLPALGMSSGMYLVVALLVAVLALPSGIFDMLSGFLIVWGIFGGICQSVSFLLYVRCLKLGPYGFTVAVGAASCMVPVLFSVVYWNEPLHTGQALGIALTLLGLLLIFGRGEASDNERKRTNWLKWAVLLTAALILNGGMLVAMDFVVRNAETGYLTFLSLVYTTGAVVMVPTALKRHAVSLAATGYGAIGALASVSGNYFSLKALEGLPGAVVFPTSLAAPVIVAVILSQHVFGERISRPGYLGILCGVLGVSVLSAA